MKKIIVKLLEGFGEMLTYFTVLTFFMLAFIIARAIPYWFPMCAFVSFLIYLFEHSKTKKGKKDEE